MTYTVTHQTTHILSPGGPQNALDKSHTKPPARQAVRRTGVLDRCRRAKDKPGGQPRRVAPLLERRLAPERRSQPCSERVGQTPLIHLPRVDWFHASNKGMLDHAATKGQPPSSAPRLNTRRSGARSIHVIRAQSPRARQAALLCRHRSGQVAAGTAKGWKGGWDAQLDGGSHISLEGAARLRSRQPGRL